MPSPEAVIAAEGRALGFTRTGWAPLAPLSRQEQLRGWLAAGRAGEMRYLERSVEGRLDPRQFLPWARSVISVASPYRPPPPAPGDWRTTLRGRIAAYAVGLDYHGDVAERLERLAARLRLSVPDARFRAYVDTGPVLERAWAARAGLGWIGKNTLLLDRAGGSYVFLGELFTDLQLEPGPLLPDHCRGCTRCLTACPTGALDAAYTMDPRRCISYLTIEHRGPIPPALRTAIGNWVFGCDLCQEACPWNRDARDPTSAEMLCPDLPSLLALDGDGFRRRFGKTAIARAKRRGLLRNAAVALGNSGNREAVPALTRALGDPEPLVRAHAAWALGRLGGGAARQALAAARRREPDASTFFEIEQALSAA